MTLTTLGVRDIRNIKACDLSLSSGFNFFIGPNGSGKTSILEALYLLGHGRSFRSAVTARVIRYQQACLVVHGKIKAQHAPLPLGLQKNQDGSNLIRIGGERSQKLVQLAQVLPIQLIHPDGFELITGGPKFRRAFIDWGVFHVEPLFFSAWSRIRRLLKQRNALLKSARSYQELAYWDSELVALTEQITQWRTAYLTLFIPQATCLCQRFLPNYQIDFTYKSGWDKKLDYAAVLVNHFERDRQLGFTCSGLHKSDLCLKVGGIPVEDVLSRGQLKLLMCALRLAQGQQLNKDTNKECLYLIDDFASELDGQRKSLLVDELIAMNAQVFISAIGADQVAEMLIENSKMFHVEQGKITEG